MLRYHQSGNQLVLVIELVSETVTAIPKSFNKWKVGTIAAVNTGDLIEKKKKSAGKLKKPLAIWLT